MQTINGPLWASRCALTRWTVPSGATVIESSRRETGRKPSTPRVRCAQRATERETVERSASAKSALEGPDAVFSREAPKRLFVLLVVVNSIGAAPAGRCVFRCVAERRLDARRAPELRGFSAATKAELSPAPRA